ARFVQRRPVTVLLTAVLGLGVIAVPAAGMELGLPDEGSSAPDTTQRKAYDMLSESFGAGFNGPLMVTLDARGADDPKAAADTVGEKITGLGEAAAVTPANFNEEGDTAVLTVMPKTGPSDVATESLVHDIRSLSGDIRADTGATMLVTGATAMTIDFSQTLDDALIPYLALVVGLAFLLLMLVFRSVLVPLKAALGFLLSVAAALGAVVAVFQWGWLADVFGVDQPGPIMSMMPIFMIGVVFGLAMDYEVFLVTRMREAYVHGQSAAESVTTGFTHGGRVVAAAAIIMISVFSGFILENDAMIKMMGFGLAIAVQFDAFVVRMAIVPAVLRLDAAWHHTLPGTRDLHRLETRADGTHFVMDRRGPRAVQETVTAMWEWLRVRYEDDPSSWHPDVLLAHPGGTRVLEYMEQTMPDEWPSGLLSYSRDSYTSGNRGGAAVFDILRRAHDAGQKTGSRAVLYAAAPGLTATALEGEWL
ncbi:MMPL family transporter, partial [Streptomyces violaceoruber]